MALEVVWHGGMKDTYLCVTEPTVYRGPDSDPMCHRQPRPQWQSSVRQMILARLEERPAWAVKDLIAVIGCSPAMVYGILHHFRADGIVESGGYGQVRKVTT